MKINKEVERALRIFHDKDIDINTKELTIRSNGDIYVDFMWGSYNFMTGLADVGGEAFRFEGEYAQRFLEKADLKMATRLDDRRPDIEKYADELAFETLIAEEIKAIEEEEEMESRKMKVDRIRNYYKELIEVLEEMEESDYEEFRY